MPDAPTGASRGPTAATNGGNVPRPAGGNGQAPGVYLHPGELFATSDRFVISTVLGSCVSVCLTDPVTRSGGANHFVLPHWTRGDASCRFGRTAMETLLARMLALGCERRNLAARVFGGASQFPGSNGRISIGQQNVEVATGFLEGEGISILVRDVGGARGRKVVFHTDSGDVWVKPL